MQPHWTLTISRGEFVYTVRAVGAGLGPRGVELAGAAAPGFRAFERCSTGQGRDAGLGFNTITDAGMATHVTRVLARERKEDKYVVMTIEAVVLNYLPRNANHQAKTLQLQTS